MSTSVSFWLFFPFYKYTHYRFAEIQHMKIWMDCSFQDRHECFMLVEVEASQNFIGILNINENCLWKLSAKRLVRVLNYLFVIHSLIWISLYESFYLINEQMYHSTQRLIKILVINSSTRALIRLSVDTCCYRLWHNGHSPYLLYCCHHIITITNKLMTSIVFLEIKDAWIYCKIYLAFTLIWHALI